MIISSVGQVIADKPLAKIALASSVRDASKVMCECDVGAVAVLDGETLVGLLSERDVVRKCICMDRHSSETAVADIMTHHPHTLDAGGNLGQALEIMGKGGFHHLPVLSDGKVVGMLSADDIPEEYRMLLERFREMRGTV